MTNTSRTNLRRRIDSIRFPLPPAPAANHLGGAKTAFVLKLNASGNRFGKYTAHYLGGTNYDLGTAIAVDVPGSALPRRGRHPVCNFPVLGAFQTASAGGATSS